jgi:nucleotide-binding universal stress UspA family protein
MGVMVVGLELGDDRDGPVLRHAAELARALGHRVVLLHVAEPEPTFMPWDGDLPQMRDQRAELDREAHAALQEHAERLREAGLLAQALQFRAPTADGLLEQVEAQGAALLVVGSHQRGWLGRALHGSVSRQVLSRAPCPVLVVPPDPADAQGTR